MYPNRIQTAILFAGAMQAFAQTSEPRQWFEIKDDSDANFYSVQAEYYRTHPEDLPAGTALGKSAALDTVAVENDEDDELFQFKRWESYMEPRVYPSGDLTLASTASEEAAQFLGIGNSPPPAMAGNWRPLGPAVIPASGGGAGRLNFLRFKPHDANAMFVGSPGGGLWSSLNGGLNWATTTDNLNILGTADIVIDPTDDRIQYLATGDGDGSDTRSIGVLKTLDGGKTWSATGLAWQVSLGRRISKLLIHPTNPAILMVAASNGIYRTEDGGITWTLVFNQTARDIEFKPDDPNTVYAAGSRFYKSTNGGSTFATVSNLPPVSRFAIAVTAADPKVVYAIGSNQRDLQGFYRSSDAGNSFSTQATSPNILGYAGDGSDVGAGQAFYDLGLAVSPTDANSVLVGGVNVWKSSDGGRNWLAASSSAKVHTDIHAVEFLPGSGTSFFAATDGGLYRTDNGGTTWSNLSNTLAIAEMYRLGISKNDPNKILTGWQDNGTNLYSNGTWKHVYGGDGFECFFDWADTNALFAETQNGGLAKSTNSGRNWSNITPPGQTGPWSTAWIQDPHNAQVLYYGSTDIWKSPDRGGSWNQIGTAPGSGSIRNITVDPSNSNILYGVKASALGRTADGGNTWANIATGLPITTASISYVTVDQGNSNILWTSMSGYSAGNKVFKSTNAGAAWTNYSEGLPNLPANSVVQQKGTNGGVYLAMDVGIFYRDNTMTAWVPFFANLPNVSVRELEIFYAPNLNDSRLRAATFGRGLWESELYNAMPVVATAPVPASAARNFAAVLEKGRRALSIRFDSGKPQRYVLEITDLRGHLLERRDLGEITGPGFYKGTVEFGTGIGSGLRLVVLHSPVGRSSRPVLFR